MIGVNKVEKNLPDFKNSAEFFEHFKEDYRTLLDLIGILNFLNYEFNEEKNYPNNDKYLASKYLFSLNSAIQKYAKDQSLDLSKIEALMEEEEKL